MKKTIGAIGTIVFSAIFVVFSVLTILQFANDGGETVTVLQNGDIAASDGGAAIRISALEGMSNPVIHITSGNPPNLNYNASVTAYDFTANGKTSFDSLIEVRVPYDAGAIKRGESAGDCVVAGYYNKATGQVESVIYDIDEENSQVIITTDHLSTYMAITFPDGQTRNAECGGFPPPGTLSDALQIGSLDAYQQVVSKLKSNTELSDFDAFEVGFNTACKYLNVGAGTVSTINDILYTTDSISKLSTGFTHAGNAFIVAQLAVDIAKGDIKQLNTNLMKNLTNYGAGLINPLAGASCFAIDYSLGKLSELFLREQQKYWNGYKAYYEEYEKNQSQEFETRMYQAVYRIYKENADYGASAREPMEQAVRDLVYDYCNIIWSDDDVEQFDATAQRGLTPALQQQITDAAYSELMGTTMRHVLAAVQRRIVYDANMEALHAMDEIRRELNTFCTLSIEEIQNFSGSEYVYADCIVQIGVSPEYREDWTLQLNGSGSASGTFQVIDYLNAGAPNVAYIYQSQADLAAGNAFDRVAFTFDAQNYRINIRLGAADGEYTLAASAIEASVGETVGFAVMPAFEGYTYEWNITDSHDCQTEMQFTEPGLHTITVNVYDESGVQVAALTAEVFINAGEIALSCSNNAPDVGEMITLQVMSDTVFLADAETEWDFGDGYTDAGFFDTYQYWYDASGQYTVTVKAYRYTDDGDRILVGSAQTTVYVAGGATVSPSAPASTSAQTSSPYILEGRFIHQEAGYNCTIYYIFEFSADGTYKKYEGYDDYLELVNEGTYYIEYTGSGYECSVYLERTGSGSSTYLPVYATDLSGNEIISLDDGYYVKE